MCIDAYTEDLIEESIIEAMQKRCAIQGHSREIYFGAQTEIYNDKSTWPTKFAFIPLVIQCRWCFEKGI